MFWITNKTKLLRLFILISFAISAVRSDDTSKTTTSYKWRNNNHSRKIYQTFLMSRDNDSVSNAILKSSFPGHSRPSSRRISFSATLFKTNTEDVIDLLLYRQKMFSNMSVIVKNVTLSSQLLFLNDSKTGLSFNSASEINSLVLFEEEAVLTGNKQEPADISTQSSTQIYSSSTSDPPNFDGGDFFYSWQGIFILSFTALCVFTFALAGIVTRTHLKFLILKKPMTPKKDDVEEGLERDMSLEDYTEHNGKVLEDPRPSLTTSDELSDDVFESSDQERRSSCDSLGPVTLPSSTASQQRRESAGRVSRALPSITELHDEGT